MEKIEELIGRLEMIRKYFDTATSTLEEGDSGFAPAPGAYTVAQQVNHVARTIDWFREGAFGADGLDSDFAAADAETRRAVSLTAERENLARAWSEIIAALRERGAEVFAGNFPADDPIMPGAPKSVIIGGIFDHTAHHRGSLAVYARLLGKPAPMPYS